jgi:uncharacterized membrane protein YheB (UPF0754 family)
VRIMKLVVFVLLMGVIGAAIGWITNIVAIRLLFRPYEAHKLPLLKISLQGLIPKRQKDIAQALALVVSTELITGSDVASSLARDGIKERIGSKIEDMVKARIRDKLPFLVPSALQITVAEYVGKAIRHEVQGVLDNPGQLFRERDLEDIKSEIERIVEEKVLSFSVSRLEELTYRIAARELKHIEILGGVLGFLIGIFQGLFTILFLS